MSSTSVKITKPLQAAQKQPVVNPFFAKQGHNAPFIAREMATAPFFQPAIQPKLTVSQPGDALEKEADAVADRVMRTPDIQREPTGEDQTQNTSSQSSLSLPQNLQQEFGMKMGYDFSQTRIHTNAKAAESANALQANAYTTGNDIVFGEGQFNPGSATGKRLLAHELAHVVQQKDSVISRDISSQLPTGVVADPLSGDATFAVNSIDFTVEADERLGKEVASIEWRGNHVEPGDTGASTNFNLHVDTPYETEGGKVSKVNAVFKVYVKTFYGNNAKQSGDSEYGRGTTDQDKKDKHTTLQFHESQHGQDFQDYVAVHPLPTMSLKLPATMADYNKAKAALDKDIKKYQDEMNKYTVEHTDEVGHKKSDADKAAAAKDDKN